jgi:hypothetical protein
MADNTYIPVNYPSQGYYELMKENKEKNKKKK